MQQHLDYYKELKSLHKVLWMHTWSNLSLNLNHLTGLLQG